MIRVALCQETIKWEDKKKNLEKAIKDIKECKIRGADICFFPEMSFTGFSMNVSVTGDWCHETLKEIKRLASDYEIAVGFGWVDISLSKARNCYSIVSQNGDELVTYQKIHSFKYGGEGEQFSEGDEIKTIHFKEMKFTPFICYDLRFSELFRITGYDTDVFVIPANWPSIRQDHWKTLLKARAIENQAYVLGINCVGDINGLKYSGDSSIIAPDGTIIEELTGVQGIIIADIDKKGLEVRETFPVYRDRREGLYLSLLSDARRTN